MARVMVEIARCDGEGCERDNRESRITMWGDQPEWMPPVDSCEQCDDDHIDGKKVFPFNWDRDRKRWVPA